MRGRALLGLLGISAAVLLAVASSAGAQESDGAAVFQANCSTCHGPQGAGQAGIFPPLAGNANVLDPAYVRTVVLNGRQGEIVVNGVTYNGVMPAVGANLPPDQVDAVIAYVTGDLQAQAPATTTTTPGPGTTVPAGGEDATRGEELFLGAASFVNDGPACMGCHSAGKYGRLSGPGLGGDLTDLYTETGSIDGVLAAMDAAHEAGAVYAGAPLTDQEKADLAAFLETASTQQQTKFLDGLVILGLAVLLLAAVTSAMIVAGRRERQKAPPGGAS